MLLRVPASGTAKDVTTSFTYNAASQIGSVSRNNDSYAWTGHYNVDRPYTANGLNQLTASGSTALGYDARGNLTSSGTSTYGYTSENMLTSAPGATTIAYDPLLRMSQVSQGSGTVGFGYDGADLVSEYDAVGALARRYVFDPDGTDAPLVWYEGSGTTDRRWLIPDERGSIVAVTDGSGAVTATNTYDDYGIPGSGNLGRFQYTGQAWIAELGMYNYKARVYSPTLGRFLQTDPIGYGDGPNWYNYVGGDPVNWVDPTGLKCDRVGITVCGHRDPCAGISFCVSGGAAITFKADLSHLLQPIVDLFRDSAPLQCATPALSPDEKKAAKDGDRQKFWESRARRGDPLGPVALGIVNNNSVLGVLANARLGAAIENRSPGTSFGAVSREMGQIGVELMQAHAYAVSTGQTSSAQIAAYHFGVFNAHGLPNNTFGGARATGTQQEANKTAEIWMACK